MSENLLEQVKKAIEATGYPLELEIGAILEKKGWTPFHSIEYKDPFTKKNRELDILAFKLINDRRIELRISCKSSSNKQFIFFTRKRKPIIWLNDLKSTPVFDDWDRQGNIPRSLVKLPFFSYESETVNYTVVSGAKADKESRTLLKDALFSAVNSIYHRILPDSLLFDQRGTIYFFLTILKGQMFDASYEIGGAKTVVNNCKYAQWDCNIPIPDDYCEKEVFDEDKNKFPFSDVLYWFGESIRVEIISLDFFVQYLEMIEKAFEKLNASELMIFGKDWSSENFPRNLELPPQFTKKAES
jgi:hypothetical protein